MSGMGYEAVSGVLTAEDLKQPGVIDGLIGEYLKTPVGPLVNNMTSSIYMSYSDILDDKSKLKQNVESLVPNLQSLGNTGLSKQIKIHRDRLLNPADCAVWLIPFAGGSDPSRVNQGSAAFAHSDPEHYMSFAAALTHPLSRGSSHIQSPDATVHPIIDPRYMSHLADVHVLAQAVRVVNAKLIHTEPFAFKLTGRKQPTYESFSPDTAEDFVQRFLSTQWHIIGTCSMLPREDGGVVDPKLKVYGTSNLRVVNGPLKFRGIFKPQCMQSRRKAPI
jgi:choline dehydrogenase-like flavoprotein